uniref:Uncharacterized protein n=1 Tax=Parascaris equorum TaxID=6256 RepID=A0A914R5S6_PAREQ
MEVYHFPSPSSFTYFIRRGFIGATICAKTLSVLAIPIKFHMFQSIPNKNKMEPLVPTHSFILYKKCIYNRFTKMPAEKNILSHSNTADELTSEVDYRSTPVKHDVKRRCGLLHVLYALFVTKRLCCVLCSNDLGRITVLRL